MDKLNILIFGTGDGARRVIDILDINKCNVVAYADNDTSKQGGNINQIEVIAPVDIYKYRFDYILICSSFYKEIVLQLSKLNVNLKKVIPIYKYNNSLLPNVLQNSNNEFISDNKLYEIFKKDICILRLGNELKDLIAIY